MSAPGPANAGKSGKCDPACQFFMNAFGKQSCYTLINFPSFFSPEEAQPCRYIIKLYDCEGTILDETDVSVPRFGALEFRPEDHFGHPLPDLGLIAVELADFDKPAYEHLGLLRPYFYAVFHDEDMRSVAVIHPQTTFIDEHLEQRSWRSTLVTRTADIDALEVFQLNPLPEARDTSVSICDLGGETLVESRATMAPRSVRRMYWPVAEFGDSAHVTVASHAVTAPNAKPLLVQHRNGGFSAAHC